MATSRARWQEMERVVLLVGALLLWMAGFCWAGPAADLITSLPGQPNVSFAQYAGYITIDAAAGRSFFYYFVEASSDPSSEPLTLWLNGDWRLDTSVWAIKLCDCEGCSPHGGLHLS